MLQDSLSLLRRMVATPSLTFEEDAVCTLVSRQLADWGIAHVRVHHNLLALNRHSSPEKPTLMLCAHLDTVAANEGYTFDPFLPEPEKVRVALGIDEPLIAGLGSNDDGGSVVAMTAAFRAIYEQPDLPVNVLLVLVSEEERSGTKGANYLWESYFDSDEAQRDGIPTPDFAIIGEPTGGAVATSERGLLVIDGEAHGESGHAARNEGVNALYIALEDIAKLCHFDFERISPQMGRVKLSVTQISAGSAHNVIPDTCQFVIDIRPTEQYDNAEILALLQAQCQSTLTARNLKNRSSATRENSPFWTLIAQQGLTTYSSPTTSDWMRIPIDAIKFGPGHSSRSHRPNEYILVSEIEAAIDHYLYFIQHFSL